MNATLAGAWDDTVRAAPEAVAYIDAATGRRVTRRELSAAAADWRAAHGRDLDGRTVLLCAPNGAGWLAAFLGLLQSGAVVAPLDPGEPLAAQEATAKAIGAAWLWSGDALRPVAGRLRRARDARRLLKLTSGTTGVPRALAFTDAEMLADGRQVCAGMDLRAGDLNFGVIPFGHSYGLGNLVVPLLAQGTAVVGGVAVLPHALADAIARERPTVFPAVPALLRVLVAADIPRAHLASLRTVISAGAPLAPEIAEAFAVKFGPKVHSFYGSSETGGITYDRSGDLARTGGGVGTPLPGVGLAFGRGGRVTVTSPAVFTLGNPRRGGGGFGAHLTADLAQPGEGGSLILLGRAGRWAKIAGRRVNLAEVERALRAVPGVRDAHVALHGGRAEALAAAVVAALPAEAVRSALAGRLAPWKLPKKVLCLPGFPLTARGKTDTARLRTLLAGSGENRGA